MMTAVLFSVCDKLVLPGPPFLLSAVMGAVAEERPRLEADVATGDFGHRGVAVGLLPSVWKVFLQL